MSRYIDYDAIDYRNDRMHDKSSDFIDGVIYMAQRIEEAPSIDLADYVPKDFHDKTCEEMARRHQAEIAELTADRPQGEWIDKGDYAVCSNCGTHSGTQFDGVEPVPRETNFCPNCGARMKGADDE